MKFILRVISAILRALIESGSADVRFYRLRCLWHDVYQCSQTKVAVKWFTWSNKLCCIVSLHTLASDLNSTNGVVFTSAYYLSVFLKKDKASQSYVNRADAVQSDAILKAWSMKTQVGDGTVSRKVRKMVQKKIREIFRNYAMFISQMHLERAHGRRLERGGPFKKNLKADWMKMLSMTKWINQGFLLVQGVALDPPQC